MSSTASEKLGIIGIVEQSHLLARRTLEQLGISCLTFRMLGWSALAPGVFWEPFGTGRVDIN